ncbi:MAG TPA: HNH endonuclease [Ilumatobacteraceae bacterium]|nr:HNH endonuclease [Ilumatobacteraceae bacterium]HRB02045.1 HNH endonuclease [Ilumatobacteraceae bacterium]
MGWHRKTNRHAQLYDRTERKPNGCIEWTGYRDKKGYGQLKVEGSRMERAHRQAWMLANGPIPDGMCVCHRCDNPPCVNVEHLFLGTRAENNADRHAKGRSAKGQSGEANPTAKLTAADVRKIRKMAAEGMSNMAIAAAFNVSNQNVSIIVSRQSWKDIA